MNTIKIEPFIVIGISVRTTNENGQSTTDIGELWKKFMSEGTIERIPNKINNAILSIYTDYESDYTKPYTTLLGCEVENLNIIPKGMIGKEFEGGSYRKFTAKGDLVKGAVFGEWSKIWEMDLNRKYSADFEIYGEKAQNPTDAEVDIFVAIR
ncbi:MAG: GyrI-like domain-containing protein [Bacteroidales bacterium]|nr:GyrI-like domain-containing protein [Bacteroidales bacterium]